MDVMRGYLIRFDVVKIREMLQGGFPINNFIEYMSTDFMHTKVPIFETPLMYIIKYKLTYKIIQPGHLLVTICKLLIEHKANIFMKYQNGSTILSMACLTGNLELVDLLLENKADVNDYNKNCINTPLMSACLSKSNILVEKLIQNKADVNFYNGYFTPLTISAYSLTYNEYSTIINILIDNNADVTSHYSHNAIRYLMKYDNYPLIKLLLDKGVNVNYCTEHNNTLLWDAVGCNLDIRTVELLLRNKADVNNLNNPKNESVLSYAIKKNYNVAKMLIEYKADINITFKNSNKSILESYVDMLPTDIFNFLLDNGANILDLVKKYDDMNKLLLKVCNRGCYLATRTLINNGANIHQTYYFTLNGLFTHKYSNYSNIYHKQYDVMHVMSLFDIIMINLNEFNTIKYYENKLLNGYSFNNVKTVSKKIYSKKYSDIAKLLIEKCIDISNSHKHIRNSEVIYFLLDYKKKIIDIVSEWIPKVVCEIIINMMI
jgi:ankyrin repeat protein